ncbi:MAG: cob(I)yrinic acid a,c-diamide adenosyltransferase [Paludibacter sp.]
MKLYTKTGDKGQTGLIGGTRVDKNDIRLEAYGTVDELNSYIGLLTTYQIPETEVQFLRFIQNKLFTIGAHLATDTSKVPLQKASVLDEDSVLRVEKEIDRLDETLPKLHSFILPGGSQSGALCHVCRTVARRAERRIYDMNQVHSIDNQILIFINRLSDYFFILSRFLTLGSGCEEIYWKTQD